MTSITRGLLRLPFSLPRVQSQLLASAIIFLVFAMVAVAIAGFAYITAQQQMLIVLAEKSQQLRTAHQALSAADAHVAHFVLGDVGDGLGGYYQDVQRLNARRGTTLDLLGAMAGRDGTPTAAKLLIEQLEADWQSDYPAGHRRPHPRCAAGAAGVAIG